jgi:3-hydroxyacyl-[acyl-carrier-protein] dehydratase
LPGKDRIISFDEFDLNNVLVDREGIRQYNPQRFEMEQLDAIVYDDAVRTISVGYKDITDREFWVRGHMPGMPLMPGVMMCEAAAQLASYFVHRHGLLGDREMLGFGGLEDVRFRETVRPGDRLVIMVGLVKLRRGAMCVCRFQEYVRDALVCEGLIKGIALPVAALTQQSSPAVG